MRLAAMEARRFARPPVAFGGIFPAAIAAAAGGTFPEDELEESTGVELSDNLDLVELELEDDVD